MFIPRPTTPRRSRGVIRQIPAPVGGLNARDSLAAMPVEDAITLDNVFPERSYVELRRGFVSHATGLSDPTETLMAWNGGTPQLLAVSGGDVFNVTSAGAVGTAITTGLGNSRLQHVTFTNTGGTYLVAVNGADGVMTYDGTTWATQTITGATAADFFCVTSFKRRLWFGVQDTTKAYYLAADAISGAATLFELGGVWRMGGTMAGIMSLSFEASGTGMTEFLAFVSTLGEVAIYEGTDPANANTWRLVGTYRIGFPVGRRFWQQTGGDIAIITSEGVVSLMQSLQIDRSAAAGYAVTDKIGRLFTEAYRTDATTFGWDIISYPRGHRVFVNVPSATGSSVQYVMNTLSGAWCRYTGHNALCWELLGDDLFFAGAAGTVFKADTGATDAGAAIPYLIRTAFHDYRSRAQKRFTLVRPMITANGPPSPNVIVDVDYGATQGTNIPLTIPSGSVWDTAVWDQATWAGGADIYRPWVSVGGIGYVASVRIAGNVKNAQILLSAVDVVFEPASTLTT